MLGFANTISSILYTTIILIIQTVEIEPVKDNTREISIKDSEQTEISFSK
jgi:hypothetical protein